MTGQAPWTAAAIVAAALLAGVGAAEDGDPALSTALDAAIAAGEPRPFHGELLVARDGAVLYGRTLAPAATGAPPGSRYAVASISKQVIAALALDVATSGRFPLARPAGALWPAPVPPWANAVTPHQLLNHTSGLKGPERAPAFVPGSRFAYSNTGYQLLGRMLEQATGQGLEALVDGLLARCGIAPGSVTSPPVAGHEETAQGLQPTGTVPGRDQFASGGMALTAREVLAWAACLHGGRLLPAASHAAMVTVGASRDSRWGRLGYGYGLQLSEADGLREWSHGGYLPEGYQSLLLHYPDHAVTVVILENAAWSTDDLDRAFGPHDRVRAIVRRHLRGLAP